MVVVSINLGVGYASSGVEYAQAYRSQLLRSMNRKQLNVFLDFMPDDIIYDMLNNLGIDSSTGLWLYDFFRGSRVSRSEVSISSVIERYGSIDEDRSSYYKKVIGDSSSYIVAYLSHFDTSIVTAVEHVVGGCLLSKQYFSGNSVYCKEFFSPVDGIAYRYKREFYKEDGSLYLEEFIEDTKNQKYFLNGEFYPNKESLFKSMMSEILSKNDFVIIDRSTGTAKALFELKKHLKFKLGVVVHAEHFVDAGTSSTNILWNNYYEYVFKHPELVDTFICSTESQASLLKHQYICYFGKDIRTDVIPVGYLTKLKGKEATRLSNKLVTVSRLSPEKNLDILIEALCLVPKDLDFSLDIYGEGSERNKLQSLIDSNGLKEKVFLKGHQKMTDLYKGYSVYVSASQSEGFGLSLMEAIGSGCLLLGYRVPYGNLTFCNHGVNGLLATYSEDDRDFNVQELAKVLTEYLRNPECFDRDESYRIADDFLKHNVKEVWKDLLNDNFV